MTDTPDSFRFVPHPLRGRVLAELHARPLTPVPTPSRLLRFGFMASADAATAALEALQDFCTQRGLPPPPADARHFAVDLDGRRLRYERHNEFLTYTWSFTNAGSAFSPDSASLSQPMALLPQPGPLIVAVDLHVIRYDSALDLSDVFAGPHVAASDVEDGRARLATDFKADATGFVRILVQDRTLTPASTGALVQRLLELETYRTLALLGLPEAQSLAPELDSIGGTLSELMAQVQSRQGIEANRTLLDRLTALAAQNEKRAAESAFRFGATRAYGELIDARLDALKEEASPDHSTLKSFLSRRLSPALRTCSSVQARQADLSLNIARLADLLRTRVDIELESQNALQLRQMSDRVRLQLRLQQTVEGLSVAAITYYVASVLHIVFEGAHAAGLRIEPAIATAVAVPLVAITVGTIIWRIRNRHPTE